MRIHVVLKYIGVVLLMNSLLMCVAMGVSLAYGMDDGFYPLLTGALISFVLGVFPYIFIKEKYDISKKESYMIVVFSAIASCIVGSIPFLLTGGEFTWANAWFESVSGYTTTGSSILNNVEALPKSIIFWRSCTHLLGGAGIIIYALALLPMMSKSRASLSNVELSPFVQDNYKFRMQKAVQIILYVYFTLIVLEMILLHVAGMTWFDAVNHSFSTIATGGFSTKNMSIAYYNSEWIEIILMTFMMLASIHLGLLFSTITTRRNNIFRSEVTRFYLITIGTAVLLITLSLWISETYGFVDSLRYGAFQVIATISTTGFATADTVLWPAMAIMVIIYVGLNGGCAGSTAGGIQTDRMLLIYKSLRGQFLHMRHPNAVVKIRMGGKNIDDNLVTATLIFALFFIIVLFIGTMITTMIGVDLMTSFSITLSSISNIGPGLGEISSLGNFSSLPDSVKLIQTMIMVAGRLQLFGFFQMFIFSSWK